jgi:hypothetical protein
LGPRIELPSNDKGRTVLSIIAVMASIDDCELSNAHA